MKKFYNLGTRSRDLRMKNICRTIGSVCAGEVTPSAALHEVPRYQSGSITEHQC